MEEFYKKITGFLTALNYFLLKLAYPIEIVAEKCKIWFFETKNKWFICPYFRDEGGGQVD